MKRTRQRRIKWAVYGEYGGQFTNLREACACAKEASLLTPGEEIGVELLDDGCVYLDYLDGKCIRDGWTKR